MKSRDEETRKLMVRWLHKGFPQGEALTKALDDTRQDWLAVNQLDGRTRTYDRSRSPVRNRLMPRVEPDQPGVPPPPPGTGLRRVERGRGSRGGAPKGNPKGSPKGKGKGQRGGSSGGARMQYITTAKGGGAYCREYNEKGKCDSQECQKIHKCWIRVASGEACNQKHPGCNHRQ